MRMLVDADSIVYAIGFANEKSEYMYHVLDPEGRVDNWDVVRGLDELRAVEQQLPEGYTLDHEHVTTEEPLAHALSSVKRSLLAIETVMDKEELEFDKLELFLTGRGNFRDKIATIQGYKANRIGAPKPIHYKAIRRYMVNHWGAVVVNGWEADDQVAMIAHHLGYNTDRVCIVSMDKDLRTVPGRLYNFKHKRMEIISPEDALVNFYRQMVTGDVVDHIKGVYKSGPKRAEELVKPGMDEETMAMNVWTEFEKSRSRKGCSYAEMNATDVFLETGRLLHMARTPAQTLVGNWWKPPVGLP